MKAEIITIGDEILIGQIVDTNSVWISEQLNAIGIEVNQIVSVHDSHDHILEALKNAQGNDLVLITGGLGPTKDDITKQVLCEYFNTKLVLSQQVLDWVLQLLSNRGVAMNQLNKDQAMVPENCTVLHNSAGTAPGMWFEREDVIYVSMPGVPYEMMAIMDEEVLPRLAKNGKTKSIYHKTVLTYGLPESTLAETIEDWEDNLPSFIKLAYLPSQLGVKLRLSAYGENNEILHDVVDDQIIRLKALIPEYIYGYNDDTLASVVGFLLIQSGCSLGCAESCTGGNVAHEIISVPGSSAYFQGGVVAYSNELKIKILKVNEQSLDKFGAVSEQVAREMALGVKRLLNVDYAISTTGIAGPDGGSDEKPVGTIWIAVAGKKETITQKFNFWHNRERNIIRSTQTALNMLRGLIKKEQNL